MRAFSAAGRSARRWRHGSITSEPKQPRSDDHGDNGEQQRQARFELELVAHVLHGLEADQRQQQREGDQRRDGGVLQRARNVRAGRS